jgi:hypothetical protein
MTSGRPSEALSGDADKAKDHKRRLYYPGFDTPLCCGA